MSRLPPFLELLSSEPLNVGEPLIAVHRHSGKLVGECHVLWWPSGRYSEQPKTLFYIIPGNPGQVAYFLEFLRELHTLCPDAAILARAHLGHTPHYCATPIPAEYDGLWGQVSSCEELFDHIRKAYPETRVIVMGHSIGSWITMQLLKSRGSDITAAFLLCPTLSNLRSTPNGRKLWFLFYRSFATFAAIGAPWAAVLPMFVLRRIFPDWTDAQIGVIKAMLSSSPAVRSSLQLARDEGEHVTSLDTIALKTHAQKIYLYYAALDDWVGNERQVVLSAFDGRPEQVYEDTTDVPHAFCITARHSKEVARQCSIWLKEASLVDSE